MELTVKLQVFEGPLDLLLHLLEKNKVNIYDIPIVEITNQYMEYIAEMKRNDLNVMSEFLVMAATLIDIKSRMLLPKKESEEEEEEDPRAELVQQLLEYKMYKCMAYELRDRQMDAEQVFFKEPTIPPEVAEYEEQKLIEDFNLSVKPGQRVAIVGPTGCGKTTLINLLMRFYDTNSGTIRVSGVPVNDMTRKSLRNNYGMVLQETWLRSGTIRDNIVMGKPDATDEEVIAAAKASHAHSFIKRLPQGYDTVMAEDGGNLSQGQKQLLCITRVMLCLPPMLILDEATSSIDTRTEIKIQEAFAKMMKGRTSFIVAHRLSTIQEADIILVMKDGHIIEQGRHEELLAKKGFYANLYESQFVNTSSQA